MMLDSYLKTKIEPVKEACINCPYRKTERESVLAFPSLLEGLDRPHRGFVCHKTSSTSDRFKEGYTGLPKLCFGFVHREKGTSLTLSEAEMRQIYKPVIRKHRRFEKRKNKILKKLGITYDAQDLWIYDGVAFYLWHEAKEFFSHIERIKSHRTGQAGNKAKAIGGAE